MGARGPMESGLDGGEGRGWQGECCSCSVTLINPQAAPPTLPGRDVGRVGASPDDTSHKPTPHAPNATWARCCAHWTYLVHYLAPTHDCVPNTPGCHVESVGPFWDVTFFLHHPTTHAPTHLDAMLSAFERPGILPSTNPRPSCPNAPGRNVQSVGATRDAPQQLVRGRQRHLVKLHARVFEPRVFEF